MKVRHPETKGVIAIAEAQLEVFKNQGWEQVGDEVPTDLELRDQAELLGRITGEKVSADDDSDKLRAAYKKAHPPEADDATGKETGDSTGITSGGGAADAQAVEGDKSPGRKVRSTPSKENST